MLSDPILSSMIILELSGTLSKSTVQNVLDCSDFACIGESKKSKFGNIYNNIMNFITNCKMKPELDMLRKLEEAAKNKANGMDFEHHGADTCHGYCDCGLDK